MNGQDRTLLCALSYWRGRYTPTYLGLRRIADTLSPTGPVTFAHVIASFRANIGLQSARSMWRFPLLKSVDDEGRFHYRTCWACSPTLAIIEAAALRRCAE